MASRSTIRFLRSLQQKKFRQEEQAFLVEGPKLVDELLRSDFNIELIAATDAWSAPSSLDQSIPIEWVSEKEMEQVSGMQTPNKVLAVATLPVYPHEVSTQQSGLSLLIDQLQDPGNLGTIIRIADWFGINRIICSPDTVDAFNPKVVQASMGSVFRMKVHYQSLTDTLIRNASGAKRPVYAALLSGNDIYSAELSDEAMIIMGNESRGVSPLLQPFITAAIRIPAAAAAGAESLNVSVATGITCAEFRRRFPLK